MGERHSMYELRLRPYGVVYNELTGEVCCGVGLPGLVNCVVVKPMLLYKSAVRVVKSS